MKIPLISILLPTYKNAPYLEAAIQSVCNQSFIDWELLIIDDGLNEAPQKIAEQCALKDDRIICVKNEKNLGIQQSLNHGIRIAKGKYIARIDDDDEWIDENKLSKQITFLQENPDYVLVGTNAIIVDEKGKKLGSYKLPLSDQSIRERILSKNCFLHPSIVADKDKIKKAGCYNESDEVKHIEDYALWLELGLMGKFANMDFAGVKLMIHSDSLTFQNRISQVKNMRNLVSKYKKAYPGFVRGSFILWLRSIGFALLSWIPIPNAVLYTIQKMYKKM